MTIQILSNNFVFYLTFLPSFIGYDIKQNK